ncbi:MAG: Membrane protein [Mycobacterium sp.]|nr:Membrane protein [Mycobacterium sp.]
MTLSHGILGFFAGLVIATVTAPVGISGAVFLLPVQLSVLSVPSPSVTPTNLLFNVIATPGALLRYRRQNQFGGGLTRLLIAGTLPGVVAGSAIHVYFASGPRAFRLLAAAVLLPIGVWLCVGRPVRAKRQPRRDTGIAPAALTALAVGVGVVGGIYGIGGGSILGPILVGSGVSITRVAPAALASTFVTSVVGAITYVLLALTASGSIAPNWALGLICGAGGLVGGYLGARLQARIPEAALRLLLGLLAVGLALAYILEAA